MSERGVVCRQHRGQAEGVILGGRAEDQRAESGVTDRIMPERSSKGIVMHRVAFSRGVGRWIESSALPDGAKVADDGVDARTNRFDCHGELVDYDLSVGGFGHDR